MQPDQRVAEIVRECFDGTEKSVARTVRRIGQALRESTQPVSDPRQVAMFPAEANRAEA